MDLAELYRRLASSKLKTLHMADQENSTIREESRGTVVTVLNEALTYLHSRFVLIEKQVFVLAQAGITMYPLTKENALSSNPLSTDTLTYYIRDTAANPFDDDLIRVLHVFNKDGEKVLGDVDGNDSIFLPQENTLHIPKPISMGLMSVHYQADHPRILVGGALSQVINIPRSLENALLSFIAFQVFSSMEGDNMLAIASKREAEVERDCTLVEDRALAGTAKQSSSVKFNERGWV